jgi:hypothetical protein
LRASTLSEYAYINSRQDVQIQLDLRGSLYLFKNDTNPVLFSVTDAAKHGVNLSGEQVDFQGRTVPKYVTVSR